MLVSALAPTVSRAMEPVARDGHFIELCSAAGTHRVALTAAEAAFYGAQAIPAGDGEGGEVPTLEHCPYCAASFNPALPPAADATPVFAVLGSALAPRLFFTAPRPLFAWSPAHPRAPPVGA